ncbi:hypothetical protein ElyMa_001104600 [Elysia marginata]|uniref:Uncharacterized protein n=1 Tax=Elysia marginata TaxID=1093978 RepID=A0AAV4HWG0_9GAST|nr:hypothetical protein ElyMa_001104600 [Elysia marginata]
MDLRGRPLVQKVLRPYGPIYFLDEDFDPMDFDLNQQLKKTHVDFWTAAFFTVNVVTDQENWNRRVVEVHGMMMMVEVVVVMMVVMVVMVKDVMVVVMMRMIFIMLMMMMMMMMIKMMMVMMIVNAKTCGGT